MNVYSMCFRFLFGKYVDVQFLIFKRNCQAGLKEVIPMTPPLLDCFPILAKSEVSGRGGGAVGGCPSQGARDVITGVMLHGDINKNWTDFQRLLLVLSTLQTVPFLTVLARQTVCTASPLLTVPREGGTVSLCILATLVPE